MTVAPLSTRTLVHVADASRWHDDLDGVDALPPTSTAAAMAGFLDDAAMLVVDDVLAFPFESLRDADRDVPLAVRLPVALDGTGLEAVLADDLLDHLSPLDIVAGPPGAWAHVLGRRHLPTTRYVGGADLTVEQLVNRARQWRRRFDEEWRPRPSVPGAPLDVVNLTVSAPQGGARLRHVKSRFRVERDLLRRELAAVASQQPRTRVMNAAVVARRPEVWASALPASVGTWLAVPLVPGDQPSADLVDAEVAVVEIPPHMRLPSASGELDVVIVVGDMLHSPPHAVERLLSEAIRLLRPGGWLLLLAEVVPDPRRDPERRPRPLGAREAVDLVARASGRQAVLDDVRAFRRPGDDHHRAGLFRWRCLGTGEGGSRWT